MNISSESLRASKRNNGAGNRYELKFPKWVWHVWATFDQKMEHRKAHSDLPSRNWKIRILHGLHDGKQEWVL